MYILVKGIIAYIQVVVASKRVWGLQFYFKIQVHKILTAVSVSEEWPCVPGCTHLRPKFIRGWIDFRKSKLVEQRLRQPANTAAPHRTPSLGRCAKRLERWKTYSYYLKLYSQATSSLTVSHKNNFKDTQELKITNQIKRTPKDSINPLSPNGDQHQFYPNHIHRLSRD